MRGSLGDILIRVLLTIGIGAAAVGLAWSHEVRPAFLQITERANGHYDILWKQPTTGSMAVHLVPHISGGLLEGASSISEPKASQEALILNPKLNAVKGDRRSQR